MDDLILFSVHIHSFLLLAMQQKLPVFIELTIQIFFLEMITEQKCDFEDYNWASQCFLQQESSTYWSRSVRLEIYSRCYSLPVLFL